MLSNYPTSIVVHGMALNITVQSYNGSLDFGMMACGKAMPDVADFARDLLDSYAELKALPATAAEAAAPAGTPVPAKGKRGTAKARARVPKATRAVRATASS
jgi:hypothetical protein